MGGLFSILAILASVGSIVCWIIVLVKMFQNKQVGLGIVSIICGLVAFIYGWMKAGEWKIQNIMIIWTICILAGIVFNIIGGAAAAPGMGGG